MSSKNFKYVVMLFLVFIISANKAWLNPTNNDPNRPILYKTHNTIPLFWQYNLDSGVEILTAAYFPKIFEVNNTRIDRPTYPVIANFFGKIIGLVLKPFVDLNKLEKAGIGYLVMKILVFFISMILARKILKYYFDEKTTFLAIYFMYASAFSINYFTTFHTTELQFITPIFILSIFIYLIKNYSTSKNFLFSIVIGILMLAKPNYATYLSIIIFLLYKKEFLKVTISILGHLIPIILYLSYIKYFNYDFVIIVATEYDQGTWLFNDLKNGNFYKVIKLFLFQLGEFLIKIFSGFQIVIYFSIFGFLFKYYKDKIKTDYLLFIGIFIICTYIQMFVAFRFQEYMNKDFSIIVHAFGAYGIYKIVDKFKNNYLKKYFVPVIMSLYLVFEVARFVHLPWVHPYDQVSKKAEVLNSKLSELDDITIKD